MKNQNGNGKETGKTAFLSFPVPLDFDILFFPVYGQNHEKRLKKGGGMVKKELERS